MKKYFGGINRGKRRRQIVVLSPDDATAAMAHCRCSTPRDGLVLLVARGRLAGDGVAVGDPVFSEIGGQHQDMETGEAHGLQGLKRWTNIRAFLDGTAAAVDVDVRVPGEFADGLLERLQSVGGGGGSSIDGAGNVLAAIENLKADLQDDRLRAGMAGQHGGQLAGLGDFGGSPGIGGSLLRMGCALHKRWYANQRKEEDRCIPDRETPSVHFHIVSVPRMRSG